MTPGAPPSTPDPRRFLLAKRPPSASQQETPAPRQFQLAAGAGSASSQRFPATPRFAPPSSAHTPRPPPSSTQPFILPGSVRSTQRKWQETIQDDVLESSPAGASSPVPFKNGDVREPDDIESERASEVQSQSIVTDSAGEESGEDGPTPKRRRTEPIYVEGEEWEEGEHHDILSVSDCALDEEGARLPSSGPSTATGPEYDQMLLDPSQSPPAQDWEEMELSDHGEGRVPDAQQQPTFHRAPRFQPLEKEETAPDGLPDAFSPQRRGAKYVPGGLAAEMQSWLADVRGWTGHDRPPDAVMRIVVDEVRPGNRMYLAQARRIAQTRDEVHPTEESSEASLKIMLAGEGKLTGLARKAVVEIGSVVEISQPVWEVSLEGSRWIVACEWAVENKNPL